jgi:hypothetical protein
MVRKKLEIDDSFNDALLGPEAKGLTIELLGALEQTRQTQIR